ncbi:MAG: hypothetical protein ACRDXB_09380 [Actinomycetes bacterium]
MPGWSRRHVDLCRLQATLCRCSPGRRPTPWCSSTPAASSEQGPPAAVLVESAAEANEVETIDAYGGVARKP